jgi:hypothetical protein
MPRLTDDEVGKLLRETFTEKEGLLDQLPEATVMTGRRKLMPVVLAAASVLVVLAGVAVVGRLQGASQPAAQNPSTGEDQGALGKAAPTADVLGAAIAELSKWERPVAGWSVVKVLDSPYRTAGSPAGAGLGLGVFSVADRRVIERRAGVSIEWVMSRPTSCEQADGTPYVTTGTVVVAGGSTATVGMSIWRGCLDALWLTYRLERTDSAVFAQEGGSSWRVTGTVGPQAVS